MNFTHIYANSYHSRNLFCHLNIHSHFLAADPQLVLGNYLFLIAYSIDDTIYEDIPDPFGQGLDTWPKIGQWDMLPGTLTLNSDILKNETKQNNPENNWNVWVSKVLPWRAWSSFPAHESSALDSSFSWWF